MSRTRRSILRTVSATAVTAIGAGAVATSGAAAPDSEDEESDLYRRAAVRTITAECAGDDGEETDAGQFGRLVWFLGRQEAPNPCHEPVVANVDLDDGTLVVSVDLEATDEDGCVECVGAVEYAGHLVLTRETAERVDDVEVDHGGGDDDDPVESAEIRTVDADCSSQEPPVTPDDSGDGSLEFSGRMQTPNPCYEATIEDVTLDGDTVVVTVGAEPDGSEMCIECIGSITYEGTVTLADGVRVDDVEVVERGSEPVLEPV